MATKMSAVAVFLSVILFTAAVAQHPEDIAKTQCIMQTFNGPCCQQGAQPFPLGVANCAPGFYCPRTDPANFTTWPSICPAMSYCQVGRLGLRWCDAQGRYDPVTCPPGKYCPTPQEILDCPKGYFCPRGTFKPLECDHTLSWCPENSYKETYFGGLLGVCLSNLIVLIAVIIYRRHRSGQRVRHKAQAIASEETSLRKGQDMKDGNLPKPTRRLVRGFQRAKKAIKHMDFEFNDLSMELPTGKKILSGVTGRLAPSKVTAIMGPSGAGKTTFLNTLMGKIDPKWKSGGDLKINGMKAETTQFKKVIGYVPQEDVMQRMLTPWDNIKYSAKVRLPPDWTAIEVEAHVRSIVDAMGLAECADNRIGDDENARAVSGGQRKRTNIGMELAAAPLALFLDEPTSGLDATVAKDVCTLLHDIASETGITVGMVLHQPRIEIWNSLDDLLLLAPGGRTVYQGPQSIAEKYFKTHLALSIAPTENPADVIMDAIAENGANYTNLWATTGKTRLEELINEAANQQEVKKIVLPQLSSIATDAAVLNTAPQGGNTPVRFHIDPELGHATPREHSVVPAPAATEEKVLVSSIEKKNGVSTHVISVQAANVTEVEMTSTARGGKTSTGGTTNSGNDISNAVKYENRGASFLRQLWLCHLRSLKIQHEKLLALYLESGVAMLAGVLMGAAADNEFQGVLIAPYTLLSSSPNEWLVPQLAMFINMAIGLAASAAGVKAFGEERPVYWREAAAGHSPLAYFIGTSLANVYRILFCSLHFSFVYHILGRPIIPFGIFFALVFGSWFAVYGLASAVSMVVKREDAPLLAVVSSLFAAVFGGYVNNMPTWIKRTSYAYWASTIMYDRSLTPYRHLYRVDEVSQPIWGYPLDMYQEAIVIEFAIGFILRIAAYVFMVGLNRSRQK